MSDVITQMLASRRLEWVAVNRDHSMAVIEMAQRHVRTAEVLAGSDDHAMAFTAAYDAARKALVAVLAAEGLRVRPAGGAHRNTGVAAAEFVTNAALEEFDWMRQVRNATEYPSDDRPTASDQDVVEAISAVRRLEWCSAIRDPPGGSSRVAGCRPYCGPGPATTGHRGATARRGGPCSSGVGAG